MPKYVFIGTSAAILDTPHVFTTYGQVAELDDSLALPAIDHGMQLLPESVFNALGFTADELKLYPNCLAQQSAPDAFKAKHQAGLLALHDHREAVRNAPAGMAPSIPEAAALPANEAAKDGDKL